MTVRSGAGRSSVPWWWLALAVVLLATNLRAAVNVLGPLLPAIRSDLDLSGLGAGALTALPPFCFALVGLVGPPLSRRIGLEPTVVAALAALALGQVVRAALPGVVAVFAGTTLALAAIALLNVLMPPIVARYFPGRVAAMTAAYTVTLAACGALASALTLPFQHALGGDWRLGLGMWAVLALVALVPWIPLATGRPTHTRTGGHLPFHQVARAGRAWLLAGFFGLQALQAYVVFSWYPTILADSGLALTVASGYVGLISLASMSGSLVIPSLMGRLRDPTGLVIALTACFVAGYAGTALAPTLAPWAWALLIGFGTSFFPMGLYVVSLRARTSAGLLALSGFMQGVGYLLAGTGLLVFGILQGSSTNWRPALMVLIALSLLQLAGALVSVRRWTVEGELGLEEPALSTGDRRGGP